MDSGGYNGDVSVINKRRGDNSSQNGLVEYTIEPKPEIKKIFEEGGMPTPSFNQLKKNDNKAIDTFKNAIAKAKQSLGGYGASVELKDDYTDINLYLSEDGESGFGIKPNGDIVSVFSNNKAEGGRSHYMLEMATAEGGRQLDCFDIYLTKIYEAHGFKPVAKMKWNDEYIPEGWNKENFKDYNNGEPDVVFMAYDPNNDIEKKKKEAEEKYGKKNEIPYIIDYDMGEDAQHMYKWRSPAEREAIYNKSIERYKNAKSTEELKEVAYDKDEPFLRQMDDLNSLSKEQRQSIQAEYSKRYLELIKEENPEEYKKHKKYLEKKYNIKSDASIYIDSYIDSLIDIIEYIDAKKKEFKESDVNRDEDGKFATKNSSNKSKDKIKDLDTNALKDFGLNQRQIIKLTTKLEDLGIIEYNEDNDTYKIKSSITEGIENNEIKEILGDKFDIIKNSFNSDNNDNEDDIDNEKQKSLILKENDKRTIKERIKSLPKHLQETGNKLYNNNPIPSDLIIKDDANYDTEDILAYIDEDNIDEEKYSKLNEIETLLNRFTENAQGTRESKTFKNLKKDIEELIENAPPVKNPHRVEYMIEGRDDLSIGTVINFDIRSFADFGAGDKTANKIYNYLRDEVDPSKLVVYVIDDEVNGLDMTTISSYPNQNECLINGDFIISEVEEGDEYNPPIVHLKKHKK
ncbi:hypothetical protein EPJ64_04220 [Brachyspira aalborgi]|jgi:glycerol-3-phosphate cytidylyltransferase-like family protein|nr:hypothetical protein EPJ77_04235 [Brachyspira aalborgi]TXJ19341.1 hypothetical protein EPJ64_04220 [Brachyspira aalborgi]TXJ48645.1 hypothetical protein EPJ75_04510 [Brachyspira aalborgi]